MRTIFHFGAPYNAHARCGDGPPNCPLDPDVPPRYEKLLRAFVRDFPGVDDLWVYTYDQDTWLCSEFGPCPRWPASLPAGRRSLAKGAGAGGNGGTRRAVGTGIGFSRLPPEECSTAGAVGAWPEMERALTDLARDPKRFLESWLTPQPDRASRGRFSLTSV